MKIIGITGPIASGKNEVCRILRHRGAYILDVDEIGYRLLQSDTAIKRKLVKLLGPSIISRNHNLNRHLLANIVFKDRSKLRKLEKMIHPSMVREVKKELLRVKGHRVVGSRDKQSYVVINAAILKRMKLDKLCDEIWVVLAKKEIRLKRLLKKGLTKKTALARMRAQPSEREYRKIANKIILNNKDVVSLRKQLQQVN